MTIIPPSGLLQDEISAALRAACHAAMTAVARMMSTTATLLASSVERMPTSWTASQRAVSIAAATPMTTPMPTALRVETRIQALHVPPRRANSNPNTDLSRAAPGERRRQTINTQRDHEPRQKPDAACHLSGDARIPVDLGVAIFHMHSSNARGASGRARDIRDVWERVRPTRGAR